MRLQDHNDFTTLNWVKAELDEALSKARQALEAYVSEPGDIHVMRSCAADLHQVHGTLRMVELYGAAMVVEEMEHLVAALMAGTVAQRDDAYAALMRGMVQMPDYLERLQSGHRDVPIVLLPLLNDLRASRGVDGLHESALFTPNLDVALPMDAPGATEPHATEYYRDEIAALRLRFQQLLLSWFRGQGGDRQLQGMRATLDSLAARCYTIAGRRLWWITAGVLDGLERGVLKAHVKEVRQLIGRVDRCIRQLLEHGEEALLGGDADELSRKLLYFVAQARPGSDRLDELRRVYRLDGLLPDAAELEHARGSMSGHNRALLDTVASAIKDDLLRVKDALDLFLRRREGDPTELAPQVEVLERVGDTLGMLALAVPRRVVNEQRRVMEEIATRIHAPDEEALLDVAGALLYVEASLDDHIERLGAEGAADDTGDGPAPLPRSEARHILASLMREATANTAKVKDAIVGFVESSWDHRQLVEVPRLMGEVSGAMQMLGAARPSQLAVGIGRFVDHELVQDRRVPSGVQMDRLADALAALEYYLEAAREHRGGLEHILDVTEQSLAALGYWPLPEPRGSGEEATDAAADDFAAASHEITAVEPVGLLADVGGVPPIFNERPATEGAPLPSSEAAFVPHFTASDDNDWVEVEEEIEQEVGGDDMADFAGFQVTVDGIDDEIREIFLEEMLEEIANLQQGVATWMGDPEKRESLIPVRRSFHTLKGSGRLVGARLLGEFAWKVENMLNRVLDGTITPDADVQVLVAHALAALPELHIALSGGPAPMAPLAAIMTVADRLASGASGRIEDVLTARQTVRTKVRRRVPRATVESIPTAAFAPGATPEVPAASAGTEAIHADEAGTPPAMFIGPALPPIDPVLLDILRTEVAQYQQTIRAALARTDDGHLPVDDALLRAVHTLHGAIGMVDIAPLIQVLAPMEGLLKRVRAGSGSLSPEGVLALGDVADLVEHIMAQFDDDEPYVPAVDQLADRISRMRDEQPAVQVAHVLFEHAPDEALEALKHDAELDAAASASLAHDTAGAGVRVNTLTPNEAAHVDTDEDLTADFLAAMHGEEPSDTGTPAITTPNVDDDAAWDALMAELDEEAAQVPSTGAMESAQSLPLETSAELADDLHDPVTQDIEDTTSLNDAELEAELEAQLQAELDAEGPMSSADEVPSTVGYDPANDDEQLAAEAELEAVLTAELDAGTTLPPQTDLEVHAQAPVAMPLAASSEPAAPGMVDLSAIDPDLLEVFVEEGREILDHADGVLALWRGTPSEPQHVAGLQRDLHTLKGSARMAGVPPVGDLAHAMEAVLDAVAGGRRDGDLVAVRAMERGFDQLHGMIQRLAQGQSVGLDPHAIHPFVELAGGVIGPIEDEPTVFAAPEREAAPFVPPVFAEDGDEAEPIDPRDLPDLLPEFEEEQRAPQEQIRVRAELLDTLVNHAGEMSIYRSRLEQQITGFRFNLIEHEQTVSRLRSQLRMLEIETEAQIIARYQQEHRETGVASFDPLELDRFSGLQQYSRALAESVSDLVSIQGILDDLTRQSETLLLQQSRVNSELQDGLMQTRMLPFDAMVPNLRRTLRQAAQDLDKRATLQVDGAHGEMDRNLLDRIKAPFEHMLRNAVAHGIESQADREAAGKNPEGTVRIQVSREATEVVIRVSDDGRGLDREAIRAKAIERGLLRRDARVGDDQLLGFIATPGFSTAQEVTQLAGRGVGMDVVANEIKQLGGTLSIDSTEGQGTTFTLRLPFTLAVTQAILVRIGESHFAIPMTSVQGVARISPEDMLARLSESDPNFSYGNDDYSVHDLPQLLGLPPVTVLEEGQQPLLLTRSGDLRAAIRIDEVLGSREIVVKPVGPQVSSVPGILGATIMGDGSVLIILDLAPLVRHNVARRAQAADDRTLIVPALPDEIRVRPLVMVVDDSITMRKVTGRVLERNEFEVMTAKDGVDAIEKLHERVPDLMLLDIEMPRMDGYELATHMKADARLRDVPIIMITSRTGEKHRQRAFDIGVERYIGKPYQENDLVVQINDVLGVTHG
ncbi:MAG TPA: Hpt domain-containing protein [Pinirhizobacter sp.]|uniref:Hpt domain-containing protein n=1 Tax=Pinirhizobacter sp. TaxID=2950432 RepID=UPI002B737416|nr:Hpt domain-containing protein [Pinirhizobacter sp.]HMH69222.1 Hpt domain-containing protein [Pinirhizobacter sp.]